MSSSQHLREFIRERLTAAAEEIFTEVEKTIVRYEEDIRRLEICWRPQIKLTRIGLELQRQSSADLPQQHVWKDAKEPMATFPSSLQETSSPDWEEPEASRMKEEQQEVCSSQDGEQLLLKLEPVHLLETPGHQERDVHKAEPNNKEPWSLDPSLQCDVCGKTFKSKYNTRRHRIMHFGVKPFVCSICGRGFSQKIHLKGHISLHTGEWPFYCKICSKGCVDRYHLNVHMITHSGEKLCTCEICGKRFTLISHLNSHLKRHNGEKPFSCPTCGKKFIHKISLRAHMAKHTGEKPFSCKICGNKFSTTSMLYLHKKSH